MANQNFRVKNGLDVGVGGTVITTTSSGFVGIGTTNPTSKLQVEGVVTATSYSGSGVNLTGIVTSIVAGTNITISGSTGQVTVNSSGGSGGTSSQWVSTSAGIHTLSNVGIGTTNPTSKLTVSGNVNITGITTSTYFDGSSIGTLNGSILAMAYNMSML